MTARIGARFLCVSLCSALAVALLSAPAGAVEQPTQPNSVQPSTSEAQQDAQAVEPREPDETRVSEVQVAPANIAASQQTPKAADPKPTTISLKSDIVVVGITWEQQVGAPESVEIRYRKGTSWTSWFRLEQDPAPDGAQTHATEPMAITDANSLEVIVTPAAGAHESNYTVNVIDPTGAAPAETATPDGTQFRFHGFDAEPETAPQVAPHATAQGALVSDAAAPYGLTINTRQGWGADESIRDDYDMARDHEVTYSGAVVHHTASSNDYSQAQVPGLIRGFYWYHAVTQGWGDIGYHLLVDRFGGVWEGRYGSLDRVRLGSHALGGNFQTFGISVIGTYSNVAPSAAAQDSTARAIAWMFDTYNITNAKGTIWVPGSDGNGGLGNGRTIDTISGHRQVSVTDCPGNAFFALLPNIRNQVDSIINMPLSGKVSRFAGGDRYDTAARAAITAYPGGASTVYIAAGENYPDALAGGPAASVSDAPLLLSTAASLPATTQSAIEQLRPSTVVILGGSQSIGSSVETSLRQIPSVRNIERIGGDTRYETAAKLAETKFSAPGTVYLASGENFPDALAAGPVAGILETPLLLSTPDALPAATAASLNRIRPTKVVLLGGTASLSDSVESEVASLTGATVTRFGGSDRFVTSAQITQSLHTGPVDTVYIASGASFPDALSSGPVAAKSGAAMLLVHPGGIQLPTEAALRALSPKQIVIVGGQQAISMVLERKLDSFIVR